MSLDFFFIFNDLFILERKGGIGEGTEGEGKRENPKQASH